MSKWSPATLEEVRSRFEDGLHCLNGTEAKALDYCRVSFEPFPIQRGSSDEIAYVVLRNKEHVIFFDEVEDGWEIGKVNMGGKIEEYGCNHGHSRRQYSIFWKIITVKDQWV